ncbi:MAG: TrkH family potassium uptake protein [Bacteroidales bacterium]|nr:TrkH family potassium uptake protein [Bacteroidales bacterium]
MNIRIISKNVGLALMLEAAFMLLSALVSALDGFDASFSPLLLSGILTLTVGVLPIIFVGSSQNKINTREGLMILTMAWLLTCIFGLMPFALYGGEFSLINALFESVSGITTTGATIVSDVEALPKGLLFWRSSSHFIGGLGVVVFMLVILPSAGTVRLKMSRIEVSDISQSNYNFRSNKLVRVVLSVYISLMVLLVLSYLLCGMSLFDAVNHAFSAVATGGFSTHTASIGWFDSPVIEVVTALFMVASSLHFGMIYSSVAGRNLKIFRHPVVKFFLTSLLVGVVLVTVDLLATGTYTNFFEALRHAFFNVVSFGTSTGFATEDTSVWPVFAIFLLMYFSVQCGCSGSTTGGLKSDRLWALFTAVRVQLYKTVYPNVVVPVKYGNTAADPEQVSGIAIYAVLYFMIIIICALVYAAVGMDFVDSFSSSVAMVGNIGPAFGSVGSLSNFDEVSTVAKLVMCVEMIVGRLGLFTALTLLIRKRV